MANMTKNLTTGNYDLELTPSTSAQTKTIKVGGTYCDTDIDVKVSAMATGTITPSFGNSNLSTYFDSGTSSSYSVRIRGSYTNTAGYVAAHTSAQYGSYTYYKIKSGSATPSVSNITAPSVAVSGAATGFTPASSATSYYVTVSGSGTDGSVKATATKSEGWISTGSSESAAATVTPTISGSGNKVYIPAASYGTSNSGTNQATITPSASTQYVNVTAGYTPASKITINGDSNLVAGNIKSGTSIFGVTGSYSGPSYSEYDGSYTIS